MPWVKFTRDYLYRPSQRVAVTVPMQCGQVRYVTRECAEDALKVGAALPAKRPKDDTTDEDQTEEPADGTPSRPQD